MSKVPSTQLPIAWSRFVDAYSRDHAYWYQPKGLAVDVDEVALRLQPLEKFEGTKPWRDCQAEYVGELNKLGVSKAKGPALARMLKQVVGTLGLAWVDPDDLVEITPVGRSFLEADDKSSILAAQSRRYQFWNPAISSTVLQAVQLHPVPFLARLLLDLQTGITPNEYTLFVAKAKRISDIDLVAEQIERYRELSQDQQRELRRKCDAFQIGGSKRTSILNTVSLNRPYAMKMFLLSGLFKRNIDHGLVLKPGALRGPIRAWLDDYAANGTYIKFGNEKAFFAWMGNATAKPDRVTALQVYTERGDVESAARIKKELGASAKELQNFRLMLMSERLLEDSIEQNFAAFAKQLGRPLKFVGRQYETTVGPIDILAKDQKDHGYVIIELKKGRAADKVFGQMSRYMGWVRQNLSKGAPVSGVIVGASIDDKLRSARAAHDTDVQLVTFSGKMSFAVE